MTRILDPTLGPSVAPPPPTVPRAPRPAALRGATIGLLANGKSNGMALLDAIAERLRERHGVADVLRVAKTNASAPVSEEDAALLAKHCTAVVTAIGDWGSCSSGSVLDAITFEKRGVPAAVVITAPFIPTAEAMARLSGMPEYPYAVAPHPFGSLSPPEVAERADALVARIETLLL